MAGLDNFTGREIFFITSVAKLASCSGFPDDYGTIRKIVKKIWESTQQLDSRLESQSMEREAAIRTIVAQGWQNLNCEEVDAIVSAIARVIN